MILRVTFARLPAALATGMLIPNLPAALEPLSKSFLGFLAPDSRAGLFFFASGVG